MEHKPEDLSLDQILVYNNRVSKLSLDGFVDYEGYLKRLFCFPPPSLSLFLSLYLLGLEQAWINSRHSLNKYMLKNKKTPRFVVMWEEVPASKRISAAMACL